MSQNKGGRTIFIIFWVIGSIFWITAGSLSEDFIQSLTHILIGWAILFSVFFLLDLRTKDDDESEE
tara:strand:+ start:3519 stop:3716 length:198 start_codon:yes stop_codon:yes gene_type:complete